jgi:hypothetical protein
MRLVSVVTSVRKPASATALALRPAGRRPGFPPAGRCIRRIDQSGGAHHLLDDHAAGALQFPRSRAWPRRKRSAGASRSHSSNFSGRLSTQDGSRKPKLVQGRFAIVVTAVHAAHLRHGDVALIDEQQRVLRQVLEQRRRRLAGIAAGEIAGIVLDAVAVAGVSSISRSKVVRSCRRCASSSLPSSTNARSGAP